MFRNICPSPKFIPFVPALANLVSCDSNPSHSFNYRLVGSVASKAKPYGPNSDDSWLLTSRAVGVADGVSGVRDSMGVNPKDFSFALVQESLKFLLSHPNFLDDFAKNPAEGVVQIMRIAFENSTPVAGASTYALGILCEDAQKLENKTDHIHILDKRGSGPSGNDLQSCLDPQYDLSHIVKSSSNFDAFFAVANLGDSGVMILRDSMRDLTSATKSKYSAIFETKSQTHRFNTPYQMSRESSSLIGTKNFFKHEHDPDKAGGADEYVVGVMEGDIIIAYSDGIVDNLYRREIESIVNKNCLKNNSNIQNTTDETKQICQELLNEAYRKSIDANASVPFNDDALSEGLVLVGGKPDDITVVVARVCPTTRIKSNL